MCLLCLDDHKIPSMDKLYYFLLQNEHMLPICLEDADDQSKRLMTDGLHLFLSILKMQQAIFL